MEDGVVRAGTENISWCIEKIDRIEGTLFRRYGRKKTEDKLSLDEIVGLLRDTYEIG